MTQGRYCLKCEREKISNNVFALGIMSPAALSAALTHCIESRLSARISRAFTFKRIQVNRDIIHSKSYLNISRRNSSTVHVNDLGFVEVKLYIKVFEQCQNALFCSDSCSCKHPSYYGIADCFLQPAVEITFSSDNFTNCKPGHIIPVRRENCSNIQYCAKVMQTKFVEIRPLFLRLFYEKSSNFRKMFRRVLSEKITIFLENSRERNSK